MPTGPKIVRLANSRSKVRKVAGSNPARSTNLHFIHVRLELRCVESSVGQSRRMSADRRVGQLHVAALRALAFQFDVPLAEYVRDIVHDHILESGGAFRERGGALRALINAGKAYQEGVPVSEYLREMVHDHTLQGRIFNGASDADPSGFSDWTNSYSLSPLSVFSITVVIFSRRASQIDGVKPVFLHDLGFRRHYDSLPEKLIEIPHQFLDSCAAHDLQTLLTYRS